MRLCMTFGVQDINIRESRCHQCHLRLRGGNNLAGVKFLDIAAIHTIFTTVQSTSSHK